MVSMMFWCAWGWLLVCSLWVVPAWAGTTTIAWDYVDSGQTGFDLLRCTGTGVVDCVPTVSLGLSLSPSDRQAVDATAAPSTHYCYAVLAFGSTNSPATGALCLNTPGKLVFAREPQAVTAGQVVPAPVVEITDAAGALLPLATSTITLALATNPQGGTLSGTLTQATVGGQAIFAGLTFNLPGTGTTLQATTSNLAPVLSAAFSTLGSGVDLTTDLVAYYKLDEVVGTTATDQTANGNHGTLTSGPTHVVGLYNNGVSMTGGAQRIVIPTSSSLENLPGLTWSAWVYLRSLTTSPAPRLVDKQSAGTHGWSVSLTTTAVDVTMDYTPTRLLHELPVSGIPLNSWHHWLVVWDGQRVATSVQVWLDGVPLTPSLLINGVGSRVIDTGLALVLGNRTEGDRGADLMLDEVRLYRRALRPLDAAAVYALSGTGIPLRIPPVVHVGY